jgi:hypothetical protein
VAVQTAAAEDWVSPAPRRWVRSVPGAGTSGALPVSRRSSPVPSAAEKAPSSRPASVLSPLAQALARQPAG